MDAWIGPDPRFDDKVDQFFHRLECYGGAMHTQYRSQYDVLCPDEGEAFIRAQFERFRVQVPPGAEFLYRYGVAAMVEIIDYLDPYLMFWSYSDVEVTDEWSTHKYCIVEGERVAHNCNHDELETFRHQPGAAEHFFNTYINQPGMASFPQELRTSINEYHNEVMGGERCLAHWNNDQSCDLEIVQTLAALGEVCTLPNGLVDTPRMDAYFDLALWAGALWFFGPLGRDWRARISDVTAVVLQYGECILYQGDVYAPGMYTRSEVIPGSCDECHVGAWCVETVQMSGGWVIDACEHCSSLGMPPLGFGACGKRICRFSACRHNPFHDAGVAGVYQAHRANGQLKAKAEERRMIAQSTGVPKTKLLVGE